MEKYLVYVLTKRYRIDKYLVRYSFSCARGIGLSFVIGSTLFCGNRIPRNFGHFVILFKTKKGWTKHFGKTAQATINRGGKPVVPS